MSRARKFSVMLVALLCLTLIASFGATPVQAATQPTDVSGHWAQSQIQNMISQGVLSGYPDGTFQPDQPVTRAEFITMINQAFKFTATAPTMYTDVSGSDWFAPAIAKAQAAGYIAGYPDGTMKPNAQIQRQEAAVIVAKALQLGLSGTDSLSRFSDASAIPSWSSPSCAALVKAGYMNGYPDGTFQAMSPVSRAEAAVILNQAITKNATTATTYNLPGTYGPATGTVTVAGNVTIDAAGVTLQNTIVSGNLLISSGVGPGDVVLKNVTVQGTTLVQGGGSNSVHADGCTLNEVTVGYSSVHVSFENGTTVVSVTLQNGASVTVQPGCSVGGVTVSTTGAVTLTGNFASVTIDSAADVTVTGGTITDLTIAATAAGTKLDLSSTASITSLTANAAMNITGTGTIGTANVNASGVTSTITPSNNNTATGATPMVIASAGGGGGGSGENALSVVSVSAANLNIVTNANNNYSISGKNTDPIGLVTMTFSKSIKKSSPDDFNVRAYSVLNGASTPLTWLPGEEANVKNLLWTKLAGGAANQLSATLTTDYDTDCNGMGFYFGVPDVASMEFDVFDLNGNMLTITINC